jgi:3-oxoacyl-[acyl-carrier protein] reductase
MNRALVTGAAGGIGRALVRRLLDSGWEVVATDLDLASLERAASETPWPTSPGPPRLLALDVTDGAAWERVLDEAGDLDLLVNNAGALRPGWLLDQGEREVSLHLDVNARGTALGTLAAARRMAARGKGHIVNMGSLASLAPVPGLALYAASKFAVRGLSLAAAHELRPKGLAVSLVLPDAVETPMLDLQKGREEAALTFSGGRALTADDVARAIVEVVLRDRPLELSLPASRGALARFAGAFPALTGWLEPRLRKKGRRTQERLAPR